MIGRRKTPWTTCARFLWPSAHDGGMSGATPMLSAKGAGDPKAADQLLPLSLVETHAPDLPFRPGGAGLKIFSDSVACFPRKTRLSELAHYRAPIETTNELESTRIGRIVPTVDSTSTVHPFWLREFVSIGVHSWLNRFES